MPLTSGALSFQELGKPDEHAGRERQCRAHRIEHLLELGDDPHERTYDGGDAKAEDDHRIRHRALYLAAHVVIALVVVRKAAQHLDESARRLAGANHVRIERLERLRMVCARVGKRLAADDAVAEVLADIALCRVLLTLVGERLKRLAKSHAGFDQVRKLRSEKKDFDRPHRRLLLRPAELEVPDRLRRLGRLDRARGRRLFQRVFRAGP